MTYRLLRIVLCCVVVFVGTTSCAPKPPYEVKSPCVAIETDNPWAVNPCVRRAANVLHELT